jgi:Gly-Xaa carboxypeptidase
VSISYQSSVDAVKARHTTLFKELASKFNLSYTAFGVALTDDDVPRSGSLVLAEAFHPALDPAPVTPINGAPYKLLSGTIKATYNAHRSLQGNQNVVVAPGIMTSGTGE